MATVVESPLIEAVPNFSEGRRPQVMQAIVDALTVPGVLLLNQGSDRDHNRMVVTLAGAPECVCEGLFRAVQTAADLIDMREHRGTHPRLGAADVVPLIPIQGLSLAECAQFAIDLGRRIGEELQLPVYLYEAAATRPERRNLADVRRGEYESLLATITEPERLPDFGPARVGEAGAVIVGARQFLIAYNFFLDSADVRIARRIARRIRERNGGLPAVKALGMLVDGRAQVSVNLVDYRRTPLHTVMDAVTALAVHYGTSVERSELIGLVPEEVMLQAAAHYLKLPDFDRLRVVENAIAGASSRETHSTENRPSGLR